MSRIMDGIRTDPNMELILVATDMHLNKNFGHTIDEVESKFHVDSVIDLGDYGDRELDRTKALGKCVSELADVLDNHNPEIVLLRAPDLQPLPPAGRRQGSQIWMPIHPLCGTILLFRDVLH